MTCRVAITGLGLISPLGGIDELWAALCEGRSALREWKDLAAEGFRVSVAARLEGAGGGDQVQRALKLGTDAALAALANAGQPKGRLAVVVGSTMGVGPWYEQPRSAGDGLSDGMPTSYTQAIAEAFGGADIKRTYATACAAGNYAIAAAARLVAEDRVDIAVAGGVDAFSRIALTGFSRSRAMDPDRCRPFDRERAGMQLGEGAAFVVLENARAATRRGAQVRGYVRSFGMNCDAFHATAPCADGSGMRTAMAAVLSSSRIAAADVAYIVAHATGTRASDAAEARAIADLFGHGACVSGVKGALGHQMGAAAAVGTVVAILALERELAPPSVGTRGLDPLCQIDLAMEPRSISGARFAMNNAFGFGGINSALLLEAA